MIISFLCVAAITASTSQSNADAFQIALPTPIKAPSAALSRNNDNINYQKRFLNRSYNSRNDDDKESKNSNTSNQKQKSKETKKQEDYFINDPNVLETDLKSSYLELKKFDPDGNHDNDKSTSTTGSSSRSKGGLSESLKEYIDETKKFIEASKESNLKNMKNSIESLKDMTNSVVGVKDGDKCSDESSSGSSSSATSKSILGDSATDAVADKQKRSSENHSNSAVSSLPGLSYLDKLSHHDKGHVSSSTHQIQMATSPNDSSIGKRNDDDKSRSSNLKNLSTKDKYSYLETVYRNNYEEVTADGNNPTITVSEDENNIYQNLNEPTTSKLSNEIQEQKDENKLTSIEKVKPDSSASEVSASFTLGMNYLESISRNVKQLSGNGVGGYLDNIGRMQKDKEVAAKEVRVVEEEKSLEEAIVNEKSNKVTEEDRLMVEARLAEEEAIKAEEELRLAEEEYRAFLDTETVAGKDETLDDETVPAVTETSEMKKAQPSNTKDLHSTDSDTANKMKRVKKEIAPMAENNTDNATLGIISTVEEELRLAEEEYLAFLDSETVADKVETPVPEAGETSALKKQIQPSNANQFYTTVDIKETTLDSGIAADQMKKEEKAPNAELAPTTGSNTAKDAPEIIDAARTPKTNSEVPTTKDVTSKGNPWLTLEARIADEMKKAEQARDAELVRVVKEKEAGGEVTNTKEILVSEAKSEVEMQQTKADNISKAVKGAVKGTSADTKDKGVAEMTSVVKENMKVKTDSVPEENKKSEKSRFAEMAKVKVQKGKEIAARIAEEARVAEESRKAEAIRIAKEKMKAEEARRVAEEARKAEEALIAEKTRIAIEKRKEVAARIIEEKRMAKEALIAEEARLQEEKRKKV